MSVEGAAVVDSGDGFVRWYLCQAMVVSDSLLLGERLPQQSVQVLVSVVTAEPIPMKLERLYKLFISS